MPELSLVLPFLNQEDIIIPVLKNIQDTLDRAQINYEIIMVNNGSSDRSYTVLQKLSKQDARLHAYNLSKKGYGLAIKKGWGEAKGKYVCHMVSDGQVDPKTIVLVYREIAKEKFDLVKILRHTRENKLRTINSYVYNLFANFLFRIGTHDTNASPKVFSKHFIRVFSIKADDSFLDLELMVKAKYLNLKIKEIPTSSLQRAGGKSNTSIKTVLEFINNMLRFRFGNDLRDWKKQHNIY